MNLLYMLAALSQSLRRWSITHQYLRAYILMSARISPYSKDVLVICAISPVERFSKKYIGRRISLSDTVNETALVRPVSFFDANLKNFF